MLQGPVRAMVLYVCRGYVAASSSARSACAEARAFHSRVPTPAPDAAKVGGDHTAQAQMHADNAPILVSIEGNIGAGKTTLLAGLQAASPDWTFIEEPVGLWTSFRDEEGHSLLELFYGDRRRWSYTFQNCALLTRFQNIEAAIATGAAAAAGAAASGVSGGCKRPVFVSERCLSTDYEVFTKMLRAEGSMDSLEFGLYERWCVPACACVPVCLYACVYACLCAGVPA